MRDIQFGESQSKNPEKFKNEPKYKTDQRSRITIYCNDEEQKLKISSGLANLKYKMNLHNNCDVIEEIIKNKIALINVMDGKN